MTPSDKLRERQQLLHAEAAFWYSIIAVAYDKLGRPDLAQDASRDAAANCRCILALAGMTQTVTGDNSRTAD